MCKENIPVCDGSEADQSMNLKTRRILKRRSSAMNIGVLDNFERHPEKRRKQDCVTNTSMDSYSEMMHFASNVSEKLKARAQCVQSSSVRINVLLNETLKRLLCQYSSAQTQETEFSNEPYQWNRSEDNGWNMAEEKTEEDADILGITQFFQEMKTIR